MAGPNICLFLLLTLHFLNLSGEARIHLESESCDFLKSKGECELEALKDNIVVIGYFNGSWRDIHTWPVLDVDIYSTLDPNDITCSDLCSVNLTACNKISLHACHCTANLGHGSYMFSVTITALLLYSNGQVQAHWTPLHRNPEHSNLLKLPFVRTSSRTLKNVSQETSTIRELSHSLHKVILTVAVLCGVVALGSLVALFSYMKNSDVPAIREMSRTETLLMQADELARREEGIRKLTQDTQVNIQRKTDFRASGTSV